MKDGDVLSQILFIHASKEPHEVPKTSPNTFHGITVYFSHPIPIVIPGPLALARRVAHAGMGTPAFGQMVVRLPRYAVGIHGRGVAGAFFDEGLERRPITMVANFQTNLAALAPDHAHDRGSVIVPSAMAFHFVGPAPRRILGVCMFDPFFPGVSRQRISSASVTLSAKTVGGEMLFDQPLNLMAVLQQMRSVNPELTRQVGSWHPLRHPAQYQDDRGTPIAGLGFAIQSVFVNTLKTAPQV